MDKILAVSTDSSDSWSLIKYVKNYRRIDYNFDGKIASVVAFGCTDFSRHSAKHQRIGSVIDGLMHHGVKHIVGFEIDRCLAEAEDKIVLVNNALHQNISSSTRIFYDSHCVIENHLSFSLDQFRYLLASAWISAGKYALAVHCQAGMGRTGTALIAFKILEQYLTNLDFFNMRKEEVVTFCMSGFSQKHQRMIDISETQLEGLYELVDCLQLFIIRENFFKWLKGATNGLYYAHDSKLSAENEKFELSELPTYSESSLSVSEDLIIGVNISSKRKFLNSPSNAAVQQKYESLEELNENSIDIGATMAIAPINTEGNTQKEKLADKGDNNRRTVYECLMDCSRCFIFSRSANKPIKPIDIPKNDGTTTSQVTPQSGPNKLKS